LRATIDWSYSLLHPAEQTLFAHLGVFVGGCTMEAAEAIGNPHAAVPAGRGEGVLAGVAALMEHSLLRQAEGASRRRSETAAPRLVMLEAVHEYARARLVERGEEETLRALALLNLGIVAHNQGDLRVARERYEQALTLQRPQGDTEAIITTLINLAVAVLHEGQLAAAEAHLDEALTLARAHGSQRAIAYALINLGDVATQMRESLLLARELGEEPYVP
jgi:tetratricopeptide (TPR) repeat protein